MFPPVLYPNRGTLTRGAAIPILIQQAVGFGNDACEVTLPNRMAAAGNLVVVCLMRNPERVVSSVTLSGGGSSLTKAVQSVSAGQAVEIWFGPSSDSDSVIIASDSGRLAANASEWSGLGVGVLNDVQARNRGGFPDAHPVVPGAIGNLILACASWTPDLYDTGPDRLFVRMDQVDNSNYLESAYFLNAVESSATEWHLISDADWATALAAFGPA